jgi:hypothetical protein
LRVQRALGSEAVEQPPKQLVNGAAEGSTSAASVAGSRAWSGV